MWFTSDLHFGHPFVARKRGFDDPDVDEWELACRHDERILRVINAHVGKHDDLYILGDVSSGSHRSVTQAAGMISRLNVPVKHRHLILGNHELESCTAIHTELWPLFGELARTGVMEDVMDADGNSHMLLLSHFQWSHQYDGRTHEGMSTNACEQRWADYAPGYWWNGGRTILLHGHTHSRKVYDFASMPREMATGALTEIHVGWDAWKRPVSLDELRPLFTMMGATKYALGEHEIRYA